MRRTELSVRPVVSSTRKQVAAYLKEGLRNGLHDDLVLLNLCEQLPSEGQARPELLALWRGDRLCGVLSRSPMITADHRIDLDAVPSLASHFESLRPAILKGVEETVEPLWELLRSMGYRAELDRHEYGFVLRSLKENTGPSATALVRRATPRDLEVLVEASRASLIEEGRPDAYAWDPGRFRAWVGSRLEGARLLELDGEIVFVLWIDVMRPEGWLIQGVYTWPGRRRCGFARAGLSAVCQEAFEAGACHVQLSVVEDNAAALALYERLGFCRADRLRTVSFV